jgi:hypothetical protein
MQSMLLKRQLEGAAGEVYSNLLLMRSQALEKNRSAFVSFNGGGTSWTYGLDDQAGCNPAVNGDCTVNSTERSYQGGGWKTVSLSQPFTGGTLSFEPRRGVPSSAGTIRLTSPAGEIDVNVSLIGYISICSIGTQRLGGYSACS